MTDLRAERLSLSYAGDRLVVPELDLAIAPGQITAIVGPNGCGKSTLLRGLARLLPARSGQVLLDGASISKQPTRQVARTIGLLPQTAVVPEGLTVDDLVARGRYPHQRLLKQWTRADEAAVERALELTDTVALRGRDVDELSGGQRQRAWIALVLAQETSVLLLDEPTTFLDLAHQLEVLELLVDLNRGEGRTIVLVLHDVNQAARYAHRIVGMRDGRIHVHGTPDDVVNEEMIPALFDVDCTILRDPDTGTPLCLPRRRAEAPDLLGPADHRA